MMNVCFPGYFENAHHLIFTVLWQPILSEGVLPGDVAAARTFSRNTGLLVLSAEHVLDERMIRRLVCRGRVEERNRTPVR